MKSVIPINTCADGCAYAIKFSYNKNFAITTATGRGGHYPCTAVEEIVFSDISTQVVCPYGSSQAVAAGTHGYGMGYVLEDNY